MALMGVTLAEAQVVEIRAGRPVVALDAAMMAQEPGRPVRLLEPRGQQVGTGLLDPENEVIRVLTREPLASVDAAFLKGRVRRAMELRKRLGLMLPDHAYRLIHGDGDGLSGFAADVYGPCVVLYAYAKGLMGLGRILGQVILEEVPGIRSVVVKLRARGGAKPGQVKQDVLGVEPPESMVVKELGIPFEVHPLGGLNVGLFTDMREQRRNLARFVSGQRVLNTFCYTGAISVAAARAGAASVTSVDLSSGVLKWAAENFRLSELNPDDKRYRFETSDVQRFMERARDGGQTFDMIILDPPTFSAARAHAWSMKKDYPELIALAALLLPEDRGGQLWISANTHSGPSVMSYVEEGMKLAGREGMVLEMGGLPPDHPTPAGYPEGRYLEICQLRVLPR